MILDLKEFIKFVFNSNSKFMYEENGVFFWNILKFNKWIDKLAKQVFTIAGRKYSISQISPTINSPLGDVGFSIPLVDNKNVLSFTLVNNNDVGTKVTIYFINNTSIKIHIDCDDESYYWSGNE
jgi:hypothetical protein